MEFDNNQAIYLQIADHFCENILTSKWNPGERIPSVREMAVTIEVNPNTVMRTFNYLQEKGIIFNKRGIGYFVSDDGISLARKLKRDEFVSNELPRLFKAMEVLGMSLEDVNEFYKSYTKS